jgi:hypothetical protein
MLPAITTPAKPIKTRRPPRTGALKLSTIGTGHNISIKPA